MIDDSALFHGAYDPVKAREYYLRTRKLKRRQTSVVVPVKTAPRIHHPVSAKAGRGKDKGNQTKAKSRRAELVAQKEALDKRLDRLRKILAQRVKEAKILTDKNALVPKKVGKGSSSEKASGIAPETKTDTADRNADQKAQKLSGGKKAAKAKQARERYEKEHPNTLSDDIEILQEQVKQLRDQINTAVEGAAKARQKQAGGKTKR